VRSLPPAIVMSMEEDKGTSTPKQEKEPTRRVYIPRVVVVVLLASLIASCIALFFFAGIATAFIFAGVDIDKQAVLWGIRTVAVLVVIGALWPIIRIGYDYQWTGLGEAELPKQENVEFRHKKTLWDWLQLLIVPIVLSLITVVFTWQQDARQQNIEDQRAKSEQELEEERGQDAALQAYLDQMSTLMLNRNLLETNQSDAAYTLAQARTSTAITDLVFRHGRFGSYDGSCTISG
jgi:hypothetical protein